MNDSPLILLFRADLRLDDNPALVAAAESGRPILPLYVLDDGAGEIDWVRPLGGAARWWLHGSLERLAADLARLGSSLVLRWGRTAEVLAELARETGADTVLWNRHPDLGHPLPESLSGKGFDGGLLWPVSAVRTGAGAAYKVFTPFWRAAQGLAVAVPVAAPSALRPLAAAPRSENLTDWTLRPTRPDWADGLRTAWTPGEAAARDRMQAFLTDGLSAYGGDRDRADGSGASRLSPHLRFGELSPRRLWHAAAALGGERSEPFLRQLAWRDFAFNQLAQAPDMALRPLRPEFERFPWRDDAGDFEAWKRGRTGYPMVDAAMRQLSREGWIPNRPRMVAASFLVKHLLLPWQWGEAWFWDTLVDADPANNPMGWQWVAGCGIDAAPYFRIFNPSTQQAKFDPMGTYAAAWAPEPGAPIVAHAAARDRALAALREMADNA